MLESSLQHSTGDRSLFRSDVVLYVCSTACTPLEHEHVEHRTRVKCIVDCDGHAMYFSRGMLPANKDGVVRPFPAPFQHQPYLLHLGLACFDRAFLAQYCRMPPTPLMVTSLPQALLCIMLEAALASCLRRVPLGSCTIPLFLRGTRALRWL